MEINVAFNLKVKSANYCLGLLPGFLVLVLVLVLRIYWSCLHHRFEMVTTDHCTDVILNSAV